MARPKRTFSPEDLDKIAKMSGHGMTIEQIGHIFGLERAQFNEYVAKIPELKQTILKGRSLALKQITETLFSKAMSGDNTCLIFYLKCRAQWKDTMSVEFEDKSPAKEMTEDQKNEMVRKALLARSLGK